MQWEIRCADRCTHPFLVNACSRVIGKIKQLFLSLGWSHPLLIPFIDLSIYFLVNAVGRDGSGKALLLELYLVLILKVCMLFLPHQNCDSLQSSLLHTHTWNTEKNTFLNSAAHDLAVVLQSNFLVLSPLSLSQIEWCVLCSYGKYILACSPCDAILRHLNYRFTFQRCSELNCLPWTSRQQVVKAHTKVRPLNEWVLYLLNSSLRKRRCSVFQGQLRSMYHNCLTWTLWHRTIHQADHLWSSVAAI